jgi:hypothetical protein
MLVRNTETKNNRTNTELTTVLLFIFQTFFLSPIVPWKEKRSHQRIRLIGFSSLCGKSQSCYIDRLLLPSIDRALQMLLSFVKLCFSLRGLLETLTGWYIKRFTSVSFTFPFLRSSKLRFPFCNSSSPGTRTNFSQFRNEHVSDILLVPS